MSRWSGVVPPEQFDHLADVSAAAPSDGQAPLWNESTGLWTPGDVAAGGGGGAYAETIGDGSETTFVVTHDLGTADVVVQLWDLTGDDPVLATGDAESIEATDGDTVTVTFTAAPAIDAYRVVVLASGGGDGEFSPLDIAWHNVYWAEGPTFAARSLDDDDPVETWDDESGNGRDASQATAGNRPVYKEAVAALGGRPAVDFDGSNDYLHTAAFAEALTRGCIFVVLNVATVAINEIFVSGINSGNRWIMGVQPSPNRWQLNQGSNVFIEAAFTGGRTVLAQFGGAAFRLALHVDGFLLATTSSAGSNTLTGTTVGALEAGSAPFSGQVAFVGVLDRALQPDEYGRLLAWAREHYGIIN